MIPVPTRARLIHFKMMEAREQHDLPGSKHRATLDVLEAELAAFDAEWKERIVLRANVMDGPDGPECWCGRPSSTESGTCGICAKSELQRYHEMRDARQSLVTARADIQMLVERLVALGDRDAKVWLETGARPEPHRVGDVLLSPSGVEVRIDALSPARVGSSRPPMNPGALRTRGRKLPAEELPAIMYSTSCPEGWSVVERGRDPEEARREDERRAAIEAGFCFGCGCDIKPGRQVKHHERCEDAKPATEDEEQTLDDGFGNVWDLCRLGRQCELEVVRPGKAQCNRPDCPRENDE